MKKIGILKFAPIFQYRLWGGEKLKTVLGKKYEGKNIGESWEISGVQGNETPVESGIFSGLCLSELIEKFQEKLVGEKVFKTFGTHFPLLIKFIDAAMPLSLQVHPNDFLAKKRHDSLGKNEMWYIMDTDENANLLIGFNEKLDKKSFEQHLEKGNLLDKINAIKVKKEQAYFLPAGRVHAIGAGILLAEIQQTSDVTYRVYDYDRVDKKTGEKRQLHVKESLEAMDFELHKNYDTSYEKTVNQANTIIETPYFKTRYITVEKTISLNYTPMESFKIFIAVYGEGIIVVAGVTTPIKKGETLLLPAEESSLEIIPTREKLTLLETSY